MHSFHCLWIAALAGLSVSGGGFSVDAPKPAISEKTSVEQVRNDLLKIAAEYKAWGRVDDQMRWAPQLCLPGPPGRVYSSASKDKETHGQKLYSLFVRRRDDYLRHSKGRAVVVGQAVVKQSWVPQEVTDPSEKSEEGIDYYRKIIFTPDSDSNPFEGDHFYPYVRKGDKVFKAARQADLFIMLKLDPRTPDTDDGWVYATATPDGKKITSLGKIESCMKCHLQAKSDRLFGLQK
jgi:hypothetical protein